MTGRTVASRKLFLVCLKIGSLSFGGGLSVWVHREFIHHHGWITNDEFTSHLALAQMMPGVNVVNLLIGLGELLGGLKGAIACLTGFLCGPFFAVLVFYAAADRIDDWPVVGWFLEGIAFAAVGMLALICGQGIARIRHYVPALAILAGIAVTIGLLGWSMPEVVAVAVPLSILAAARRLRKDE